jgi:hypothetical protein
VLFYPDFLGGKHLNQGCLKQVLLYLVLRPCLFTPVGLVTKLFVEFKNCGLAVPYKIFAKQT